MWQLLHDILPGASRGASTGVFVKSLKPRLISSDSGALSSDASASGFLGNSHAATMVTLAAISGPVILMGDGVAVGSDAREQAAIASATVRSMLVRRRAGINHSGSIDV
jgi:hypothetical protein